MAIKEKNGNTCPHGLFKVGDLVTFQWDDTLKDGNIPDFNISKIDICPFRAYQMTVSANRYHCSA